MEETKPNVNETKIEKTTQDYQNKTETHNTKTSTPPPKTKVSVPDTKKAAKFLGANRGKIALGAIGLGIVTSWFDGDDDDVLSSAGKGAKSAVAVSAAAYGAEHLLKTQTVQDLVRGEVADVSKSMRSKAKAESRMITAHGKLGTASKYGLAAVGIAAVLDVANHAKEDFDAKMITAQQQKANVDRQKKQKEKNKKSSYGHIRDGEIVLDLFEARSGHHKMGNAKFN